MEAEVYARLSSDATLQGLIGTNLFPEPPVTAPSLPYVVYYRNNTEPVTTLSGISSLIPGQIQIEVVSRNFTEATTIANQIKLLLNPSTSPPWWSDSQTIQGMFWMGQETQPQDDFEDIILDFRTFVSA